MRKIVCLAAAFLSTVSFPSIAISEGPAGASKRYRALACPKPARTTWAILDRDGANRQVKPYLSSLGDGEFGTGAIQSPPFSVSTDRIEFALCGHDGGGQGRNFIALVDAASGAILRKTIAPANDALSERSWDAKDLKGRKVRIEARDGIAAGAFAWLGIGKIDAGPELRIEFSPGPIPDGWTTLRGPEEEGKKEAEGPVVGPGIPFRDLRRSAIPSTGSVQIPCGFKARRIFLLGMTVEYGTPGDRRGEVRIVYRGSASGQFPLTIGSTLECENKLLSKSKAMLLHPTDDPFLYYLAIETRPEEIERVELRRDPKDPGIVSIRGITCETDAKAENLLDLPDLSPEAEEATWIESHAISPSGPHLER